MAINLSQFKKPQSGRPIIATIYGESGMGKTTLAAMFPKPVILTVEDGTSSLEGHDDILVSPKMETVQDVLDAIAAFGSEDHDRKTLIIDSVTQLATMIEAEIVDADPKAKSINQAGGGYGSGYNTAADKHRQVREWAGSLAYDRGMNVVFIAHADTETMDLPDIDTYSRYTVRMHKKSLPHYTDNVDLVALIRLKTFLRGDGDRKRAISDGSREIICYPQAASVTKNRFGFSEPITFNLSEGNPFASLIKE